MVQLLYFAWVRQKIGLASEQVTLPEGVQTARDLVGFLVARSPGHAAAFADLSAIRVALDQEFGAWDSPVVGHREIAFFPPVTGG